MKRTTLIAALVALFVGIAFVAVADAVAAPKDKWEGPNPELSALTQQFTGLPTNVTCIDFPFGGMTFMLTKEVWINSKLCGWLVDVLLYHREENAKWEGIALVTLVHEGAHRGGIYNEARAECVAQQMLDDVALLIGTRPAYIPALQHYARLDALKLPPQYHNTRRCRPNGAWDMSPNDGRWP